MEKKLEILKLSIPAINELSARKLLGGDGYGFPNEDELPKDWGNNPLDEVIETEKQSNGWNNINPERDEDWHQENDWDMDESLDDGFEVDRDNDARENISYASTDFIEKLPSNLQDFITKNNIKIVINSNIMTSENRAGKYDSVNKIITIQSEDINLLNGELVHALQDNFGMLNNNNHAMNEFQEHLIRDIINFKESIEHNGLIPITITTVGEEDHNDFLYFMDEFVISIPVNESTVIDTVVVDGDKWEDGIVSFFDDFQQLNENNEKYKGDYDNTYDYRWETFFNYFDISYHKENKDENN